MSATDRAIADAHDRAVAAGEPGYVDPQTGFFVFTAAELSARGECCGSGCRHCPYPVPWRTGSGRGPGEHGDG